MKIFEFTKMLTTAYGPINCIMVNGGEIHCVHSTRTHNATDLKGVNLRTFPDVQAATKSGVFKPWAKTLVIHIKGTDCQDWCIQPL